MEENTEKKQTKKITKLEKLEAQLKKEKEKQKAKKKAKLEKNALKIGKIAQKAAGGEIDINEFKERLKSENAKSFWKKLLVSSDKND